ncbi:hypothetical protein LIER_35252 [Lithospermum erythrorhizon]|uniref:Retroviral polymerase SH3-like domain-containing protein n=1 Tax=Lithospermum erythrorhizon TaxID=34254 RepID=A0AAV3NMH7_LITER
MKLFDLETRAYFVSRDVTFYESEFPWLNDSPELLSESHCVFSEDDGVFFVLDECIDPEVGLEEVHEPPIDPVLASPGLDGATPSPHEPSLD